MRYKTAFRLALKAIGVALICWHLPWLVATLTVMSLYALGAYNVTWVFDTRTLIGSATAIGVGLYLFYGGTWIVNRAIPSNRPYCHECAYELTGSGEEGVCPECGTPFRLMRRTGGEKKPERLE